MIEDPKFQPFLDWAEKTLGASVLRCERQGERRSGGRPAFFIDFDKDGVEIKTYARMDRGDGQLIGKAFGLDRVVRELHGDPGSLTPKRRVA